MIVGTDPKNQILQHKDATGKVICTLQPDDAPLKAFGLKPMSNVHCVDTNPQGGFAGMMADFNAGKIEVKKYEISEDDYKKKDGTFHKYKSTVLKKHYEEKE